MPVFGRVRIPRTAVLSPLSLRGLHSPKCGGAVVAGVIGHSKVRYDLCGDTVKTASRMHRSGVVTRFRASPIGADDPPHAAVQIDVVAAHLPWSLVRIEVERLVPLRPRAQLVLVRLATTNR